jgi:hypothetical protein
LHCCIVALLHCCIVALLHCCIVALLHCCIVALLHCCIVGQVPKDSRHLKEEFYRLVTDPQGRVRQGEMLAQSLGLNVLSMYVPRLLYI